MEDQDYDTLDFEEDVMKTETMTLKDGENDFVGDELYECLVPPTSQVDQQAWSSLLHMF